MKHYLYILLCALPIFFVRCTPEKEEQPVDIPSEGKTYTLTGIMSEKTRALIDDDGTFSWEAGDEVAVLDSGTGELCVFTSEKVDGVFTFTGEPGREYNFTRAWYPATMVKAADVFTFPSEWQHEELSRACRFPMAATVTDGMMPFYHVAGLLKLTVKDVPANAISLVLSSPDVRLSGDFPVSNLGLDEGRIDADAENVTVEDGEIPLTKAVSEIEAPEGTGSVSISLGLSSMQDVSVYVPMPCGNYKYTIALKTGGETILERTTSSSKDIARADLILMSALSAWPKCNLKAQYGDVSVDFGPSELWGWFKASGIPAGQNISINDTGSGTVYGVRNSTKKMVGYYIECVPSGSGVHTFPLKQESDIYISSDLSKFFLLAAGSSGEAVVEPTEYEVAHFGLRGNFGSGTYTTVGQFVKAPEKEPVSGWGWYVVRNVPCTAVNIEFKLYANTSSADDGLVVTSTSTRQNAGIGRSLTWTSNGQYPIFYRVSAGVSYDFYLREDLRQIYVYEAGSQGAMDTDRLLELSNFGLYNYADASWICNPGEDQSWITTSSASSFVIADGFTYDLVEISGIPASLTVGQTVDNLSVNVSPSIGTQTSSSLSADVLKVDGDTAWLLSEDGTGMIIRFK
ncbi:MAG: hypothetical protein IKH11_07210 [Bacteroidales bacterium]|nr:hypothetical protein [Bacteroidales bacterium]